MTPRISILLPVFNAERTLGACLRSVQRQTEPDWECIVVDDGSEDGSLEYAHRLAASDPRFHVVSRPHRGLVDTLNDGLSHCRGELIARMDADDLMHRRRLAQQIDTLGSNDHLAAVGCHVRLFPRAILRDGRREYESWLNQIASPRRVREEAFVECPIAHPTLVIRRAVLAAFGYRDCGWPEDYDLMLRLLSAGLNIGVVPQRLHAWRDDARRLSRTGAAYDLERFTACKASFLAATFLAAHDSYVLCGYGATGKTLYAALLRHGKRPAHIVDLHPGRLGKRIHGAPVVHPERLPDLPRLPIVASIAHAEPRRVLRQVLTSMGFRELEDFVCAA